MTYTEEERAEFRRWTAKEEARKANALTPAEKAALLTLARENARKQGPMAPLALKQWASDLLGRELPGGELISLMSAQRAAIGS